MKLVFPLSLAGKGAGPGAGVISAFYCPNVSFLAPASVGDVTDWDKGNPKCLKGSTRKTGRPFWWGDVGSGFLNKWESRERRMGWGRSPSVPCVLCLQFKTTSRGKRKWVSQTAVSFQASFLSVLMSVPFIHLPISPLGPLRPYLVQPWNLLKSRCIL